MKGMRWATAFFITRADLITWREGRGGRSELGVCVCVGGGGDANCAQRKEAL